MDITPQLSAGQQLIQGYGGGAFIVSGQRYEHSLILLPEQAIAWNVAFTEEALMQVAAQVKGAEILLIGTGKQQVFIAPSIRKAIKQSNGIVIEVMDTGAACRTFNVLLAEDRRVAAALEVI
jgi:uncharacterized protein